MQLDLLPQLKSIFMKVSPATRRKARHFGMQALYQWSMTGAALNEIEAEFHVDNDMTHTDIDYFHELVHQVPAKASELDETYFPYLQDRSVAELDPITLSLLRLSTYELMYRIDVPYKVVINESVSLAKKFGATDSFKFINGVLDKLAVSLRAVEVKAERS
ncbi:MAG: N utilization substance protein B [Candidatus Endobugula sp.]|jgi:N utilization substance protein B